MYENSWKETAPTETDWLVRKSVQWKVRMLQVQRLIALSRASSSPPEQPFLTYLCVGANILWLIDRSFLEFINLADY